MLRAFSKNFNGQTTIILDKKESHHIACVLRAKEKDKIEILNGSGLIGTGLITSIDKKVIKIQILQTTIFSPTQPRIMLLHAALTNNNTDFVIKEASAIGVHDIWIFQAEYSESKIKNKSEQKLEHWNQIVTEACKQSRNPYLPNLYFSPDLYNIILPEKETLFLFGNIDQNGRSLLDHLQSSFHKETVKNIVIAIGPEGDFSTKEKLYLREKSFIGCGLGSNILRSQTAIIYALSVINNYLASQNIC